MHWDNLLKELHFEVRIVPVGTGSGVWDNPHAERLVQRFMPRDRSQGPTIGILHLGAVHPTPNVLRDVVVSIGEDVRAGRYGGNFTFVVSSEDDATRGVICDMASAKEIALFVSASPTQLEGAQPAGFLTVKERETMSLVLNAGGTVTAAELGEKLGIEQTTAGNRLVSLHRKGYLQRIERPHPFGDSFIDPRSVRIDR